MYTHIYIYVFTHTHALAFSVFPAKDRNPCAFEQHGTGISILLGLARPERGADIKQSYPGWEGEKIPN